MRNLALMLLVTICTAAAATTTAHAQVLPGIYAGMVAGYTGTVDQPSNVPDPMGPAIGARVGVTLPLTPLYLGGLFLYHTGEEIDVNAVKVSSSSYMLGAEVGYQLGLGLIQIRPNLGFGYHSVALENLGDDSRSSVYLSPGVNAMITLGMLLGAEIRYNTVFNDDIQDSVSILGTVGLAL